MNTNIEIPKFPTSAIEHEYISHGLTVGGMDEVGRGSWAGPLVMAAVIPGVGVIEGVRDSKKIAPKKRELLSKEIIDWAKCYSVGVVTNNEIDQWGMSKALKICATRTLKGLQDHVANVDVILLDGNIDFLVECEIKTELIIKGDNFSHVIACASIIAKVYRDNYMSSETVAGKYKEFYFEKNKGYPAPVHNEALKRLGATPLHRVSWDIFGENGQDFKLLDENALF